VGAGLGGLALFGAGSLASETFADSALLAALFLTSALLAAAALAFAYYGFEWAAVQIERRIADGEIGGADGIPAEWRTPSAERLFRLALVLLVLAALLLLLAAWSHVFSIELRIQLRQ
jgi:hypothetical protein